MTDHAREKELPPLHQVSQDQIAQVIADITAEMRHELFIVGNHPALGVDHIMVERWLHRLLALLVEDRPPHAPQAETDHE